MHPVIIERNIRGIAVTLVCGRGLAAVVRNAAEAGDITAEGVVYEPLLFTADVLAVCGEAHQPGWDWDGLVADAAETDDDGVELSDLMDVATACLDAMATEPTDGAPPSDAVPVGSDDWHSVHGGARMECFE